MKQKEQVSNSAKIAQNGLLGAVQSPINDLYIITDEDGKQYVADNFTEADAEAVEDGLMTIVRCSDAKQLAEGGSWVELPKVDWH